MVDERTIERCAQFFKALSNPERLRILDELLSEELCQCELFPRVQLAQSTVSSYLSQLVRVGVLKHRKEGQRKIYTIADPRISELLKLTREIVSSSH